MHTIFRMGPMMKGLAIPAGLLAMVLGTAHVSEAQPREKVFRIDVYAGESRALFIGEIYYGSVEALRQVLDAYPGIQLIGLNSSGGNINVGRELFFLIRERDLSTFAWQKCASACTLAFMGGQERLLGAGSAIGFHADDGGGQGDNFDDDISFASRARPLAEIAGIDLGFVDYAYSTDASGLFIPPHETLIQNGFATGRLTGFHIGDPIDASYVFTADPFSYAAQALIEQRWEDAARDLEEAIKTGVVFPEAHFILGYLYGNGLGVTQDYLRAAELYGVASDAGYPQANHNLGLMLLHGKRVEEDRERGVQLVRRAADAGDVNAKFNLARWYTDGRYGERNLSEAFLLLTECANAGKFECQLELAYRYSAGEGAPLDLRKARVWYSEALRRRPESSPTIEAVRAQIEWIDEQLSK